MRIDFATGAIFLPHTPNPITHQMTGQAMYEQDILRGEYRLRGTESIVVTIGDRPAGLVLHFEGGRFYQAEIHLSAPLPGGYNERKAIYDQAGADLGFGAESSRYGKVGWSVEMNPREGEMWGVIHYY